MVSSTLNFFFYMQRDTVLITVLFIIGLFGIVLSQKNLIWDKAYLANRLTFFYHFIGRKIVPITAFSCLNYFSSIEVLNNLFIFSFREITFFIVLLALNKWDNELAAFQKEDLEITSRIYTNYPFLRYSSYVGFCLFFLTFLLPISDFEESFPKVVSLSITLVGPLLYLFVFLYLVHLNAIISNPEISVYFNVAKAIRLHGLRSFSTASTFYHLCKLCGRGAVALFAVDVSVPIFAQGDPGARGFTANYISEHYTTHGIKGRLNSHLRQAGEILDSAPEARSMIVDDKNNVLPGQFGAACKKYGLTNPRPLLYGEVEITHKSSFPYFFKKK